MSRATTAPVCAGPGDRRTADARPASAGTRRLRPPWRAGAGNGCAAGHRGVSGGREQPPRWQAALVMTMGSAIAFPAERWRRPPAPILVAEDDPALRELLRCALEAAGWPVASAADGQEALLQAARE